MRRRWTGTRRGRRARRDPGRDRPRRPGDAADRLHQPALEHEAPGVPHGRAHGGTLSLPAGDYHITATAYGEPFTVDVYCNSNEDGNFIHNVRLTATEVQAVVTQ